MKKFAMIMVLYCFCACRATSIEESDVTYSKPEEEVADLPDMQQASTRQVIFVESPSIGKPFVGSVSKDRVAVLREGGKGGPMFLKDSK